MNASADYHWRPIEDYKEPASSLAKPELYQLAQVWEEQRQELEKLAALREFHDRLKREWAIETGLLERIYTLDRGTTQILIERGIDASYIPHHSKDQNPHLVAAILHDHEAAIEALFDFVRGERQLSTSYIKELHALLTRNQPTSQAIDSLHRSVEVPLAHGQYKLRPNNPRRANGAIHQYCPPEQTASEMDRLVDLHLGHKVEPEVEAAWLHHRFTQIHPFQDGNGRVARALASLVLIRAGWFPLVIRDQQKERANYLDALATADQGDLRPLVKLVADTQRRAFVQALGLSDQVLRLNRAEQVIEAARDDLARRHTEREASWEGVKTLAQGLLDLAEERFATIAQTLETETQPLLAEANFWAESESHGGPRDHFFRWQIIQVARQLEYFANTQTYRAWARLVLRTPTPAEILVSFHVAGKTFRGVLVASAGFARQEETEEGTRQVVDVAPLSSELFHRFREWLEEVLVRGLENWRKGL